jgi:hypothetical protein
MAVLQPPRRRRHGNLNSRPGCWTTRSRAAPAATCRQRRCQAKLLDSRKGRGKEGETRQATGWRAKRFHRARRVAAPDRVVASLNPFAPDTGLRHRMVREIDGRTDEAPGRDDKDVGVRSFSCGVARKEESAWRWLGGRGKPSRAYRSRICSCGAPSGCTRARMVLPSAAIVQQKQSYRRPGPLSSQEGGR